MIARQALEIPLPEPDLRAPHQPGITDPQWSANPPSGLRGKERELYGLQYAGRVDRQGYLAIAVADLEKTLEGNDHLAEILRSLSGFISNEMSRRPSKQKIPILTHVPRTYRVTITLGFGSRLFRNEYDDDRFQIDRLRPRELKPMPRFPGDARDFNPEAWAGDLIFLISSDHPYVNIAIVRAIDHGYACPGVRIKHIELGYARPDTTEYLKFDDGTNNPTNATANRELDRLVYVHKGDDEPAWCVNGTYLVYRKILEDLERWEHLSPHDQERLIGRRKRDGRPLCGATGPGKMVPVFWDRNGQLDSRMPANAHILKSQPRRLGVDFTGTNDLDRRFLRRPYPFFSQEDAVGGKLGFGLQFLAFMRNLGKQFEWVTRMWQMNPHFPVRDAGIDALYANHILSTIGGGYYFCPPAPQGPGDYLGSGLITRSRSTS